MPNGTPQETITRIREKLLEAEEAQRLLHEALLRAFRKWGHMLVRPDEIEPLASGGTPKLLPPEDEGD